MVRLIVTLLLVCLAAVAYAGRDPTMPQTDKYLQSEVVEEGPTSVSATLVLVGEGRKLAIVNNRVLRVGDAFEGGKMLDINEDGVEILQASGEIIFLPVQASTPKAQWKFLKVYNDETTN